MSKTSDMNIQMHEEGLTATPPCTYECVEYSDGYYHTVFDCNGAAIRDFLNEREALAFLEKINHGSTIKGSNHG